ncbi:MAG: Maf family protein [Sphingomicrobium sp.]
MTLLLASSSAIRRQMLEQAGVNFESTPANLDESIEKKRHSDPRELAIALARAKAVAVSSARPEALVIGSDSVVTVGGRLFDKPADKDQAADHLRFFSGKPMQLTSAVAIARAGEVEWSFCNSAQLRVRELSEHFIGRYLDAEWPEVSYCVGVFRMEGRGVQLFDSIEGSFFTILGMPLIPLLGALRDRGVLEQ